MRRQWKVVVVVGGVRWPLLAVPISLSSNRDDDLNWIRRYGPTESVYEFRGFGGCFPNARPQRRIIAHEFQFGQIPNEVEQYVATAPREFLSPSIDQATRMVTIYVIKRPSWVEERWHEVKVALRLY